MVALVTLDRFNALSDLSVSLGNVLGCNLSNGFVPPVTEVSQKNSAVISDRRFSQYRRFFREDLSNRIR